MAGIPRYRVEGLNSELEKLEGDAFGKLSSIANGFHQDETNKIFSRLIPNNIAGVSGDVNYYYLGKIYSSSNPPAEILASHASEYFNDGNNPQPDYLEKIPFQYRTYSGALANVGNWASGYTNDLNVPLSGFIDPATGTYDYEVRVGIPEECSRVYWKSSGFGLWTNSANSNSSRGYLAGFNLDGYGYTAGGETVPKTNVVEKYDDISDSWIVRTAISSARSYLAGFGLNNFGYVAGGTDGSASDITQRYNALSNSWSTMHVMPAAKFGSSGFNLNNFGYAAGGSYVATVYKYNDLTDLWSSVAVISGDIGRLASFSLNEFGYISGGSPMGPTSSTVQRYNDFTNAWTNMGYLPSAKWAHVGFSLNGFGYNAGGFNGSSAYVNTVEKYDSATDSWSSVDTLTTVTAGLAGFSLNQFGYVVNGTIGAYTWTTVTEKYSDLTQNWPKIKGFAIKIIE